MDWRRIQVQKNQLGIGLWWITLWTYGLYLCTREPRPLELVSWGVFYLCWSLLIFLLYTRYETPVIKRTWKFLLGILALIPIVAVLITHL